MTGKIKSIVFIVIIFIILLIGYLYFFKPTSEDSAPLISSSTSDESGVGMKIISLLSEMKKIVIDQKIFSGASFLSLRDFGVEIRPELVGRTDPFAPLGFDTRQTSVSTTTATTTKIKP